MEKVQPEELIAILKEHGTHVTTEEAKLILEFMSHWAEIVLTQYLRT
jgi:hypothetical protein